MPDLTPEQRKALDKAAETANDARKALCEAFPPNPDWPSDRYLKGTPLFQNEVADYIALASPLAVRALIAQVGRDSARIRALREMLESTHTYLGPLEQRMLKEFLAADARRALAGD